ncbi:MAG: DUF3379 family protein [Burkholderiales bacterium]
MNCLDYRRALLAEGDETQSMQAHRLHCTQCKAFFADHRAMERDLRRALEVPVPAGLESRLVDRVFGVSVEELPNPHRRRWMIGAAATAISAIAGGAYFLAEPDDPLALACIQWVIKEEAKSIMMGAMPREESIRVLHSVVPLERIEQIGQVRHIAPCPFNDGTAYHVVLSRGADKVTLLVMPDSASGSGARALHEGMFARVIPIGSGRVGVIGTTKASVASVAAQLRASG